MLLHCGVDRIDEHFIQPDTPFFVATHDVSILDPTKENIFLPISPPSWYMWILLNTKVSAHRTLYLSGKETGIPFAENSNEYPYPKINGKFLEQGLKAEYVETVERNLPETILVYGHGRLYLFIYPKRSNICLPKNRCLIA